MRYGGYILIVRKFIQRFESSTPGITGRMTTFFDEIKPLTSPHTATRGSTRKFHDINFDKDTFSNPNAFLISPSIIAFQKEFSILAYAFLHKVGPKLTTSCPALSQNLAALNGRPPKRTAIFAVYYNIDSSQFNNNGLAPHVDREAPIGALALGGTIIPPEKTTLRFYDTADYLAVRKNPNDPKFNQYDVSYSLGDLVLGYGAFTHESFVAVNGRVQYTQFLDYNV